MIKEEVLLEAEQVEMINSALELQHQKKRKPALAEQVLKSVAASSQD